jgi:5-oxoprolinase (ATP-hydrolysing) subunit A
MSIDINCDMGEGMPNDAAIMPFISSANIACGYHAGDEATMRKTVELCLKHHLAIGAHPGFDDKQNFGRTSMQLSSSDLYNLVTKQLHAMQAVCREFNATLHHVKPHGAMYNTAAVDVAMSATIAKAVYDVDAKLIFYGLSGSAMISEAKKIGLTTAHEAFADRTYQQNGSLTPRTNDRALLENEHDMLQQILMMVKQKKIQSLQGEIISVQADTICIHGDGKHALTFAQAIHKRLRQEGIAIQPMHRS